MAEPTTRRRAGGGAQRAKAAARRRARRVWAQRRYVCDVGWCDRCCKKAFTNHGAWRLAAVMRSPVEVYPCPANRGLGWFHVSSNLTQPRPRRQPIGDDHG